MVTKYHRLLEKPDCYQGAFWFLKYYNLVSELSILYLDTLSDFLEVFTSSTNVLIYAKFNEKFQRKFLNYVCLCLKPETQQGTGIEMVAPKKRSLKYLLVVPKKGDDNPSSNFYSNTSTTANKK